MTLFNTGHLHIVLFEMRSVLFHSLWDKILVIQDNAYFDVYRRFFFTIHSFGYYHNLRDLRIRE